MRVARAGDHAVLIEFDPAIAAAQLHAAARLVRERDDVLACIVGHSSLYIVFVRLPPVIDETLVPQASQPSNEPATHTIKVSFRDEYAPDLNEFLSHTRLTRDEFTKRLRKLTLIVRYLGFRGGFAYLDGWPAEWAMPRRATSRPVWRGSFAIAGAVAGFYPLDTPGGWNILGRTGDDIENRFTAGDEIVIEPVDDLVQATPKPARRETFAEIEAPFMTRVGLPNWSNLERGLPVGGPFDLELAAATGGQQQYEFAQIGPKITRRGTYTWADLDGVRTIEAPANIGRIANGLRGYLATGRATEARGPRPEDRLTIRTIAGPHEIGATEIECEVTPSIDRVGIRMRPRTKIEVAAPADLPSLGMQFGTLQLHPNGDIVAMGPDHPVTGGYLQPMTVIWADRWKLAHLAPGERVRFIAQ